MGGKTGTMAGLIEAVVLFVLQGGGTSGGQRGGVSSKLRGLGLKTPLPTDGAILVFMPGLAEIIKLSDRLASNGAGDPADGFNKITLVRSRPDLARGLMAVQI